MEYTKDDYAALYQDDPMRQFEHLEQIEDSYIRGLSHACVFFAILVVVAIATGCATVEEHTAPADWPTLTVRDNVVGGTEVIRRCYKYVPTWQKALGTFPMACAEIDFAARTCNIWRAYDASDDIIEHERAHCRGGQHPGDTTLADAWNAYRGRK